MNREVFLTPLRIFVLWLCVLYAATAQTVTVDPGVTDGHANSLRDIIVRINNGDLTADTVLIPNGATVTLAAWSGADFPTDASQDDLVLQLSQPLTIRTPDPTGERATIRADHPFRLFFLVDGDLTLENLELRDGFTRTNGSFLNSAHGGAILAWPDTSLTIRRCVFHNNRVLGRTGTDRSKNPDQLAGGAGRGGAIYAEGTVQIEDSLFQGNVASGGTGGKGHNDPIDPDATNRRAHKGGHGGDATGGAIHVEGGDLTLIRCTFGGFEPIPPGGFSSNMASPGDGGTGGDQGTWGIFPFDWVVTAGDGGDGGDGRGGAVFFDGNGTFEAVNTTFADNLSRRGGPGQTGNHGNWPGNPGTHGQAFGGALVLHGDSHALLFCTLYKNTAANNGGGISHDGGPLHLRNTVIAGNTAEQWSADDLLNSSGPLATFSHNFIETTDGFSEPAGAEGNILGESDHGLLEEMRLFDGATVPIVVRAPVSPFYGKGDPDTIGYPATDARGLSRVFNGTADIGATEARTHTFHHGGPYEVPLGGTDVILPEFDVLADGDIDEMRWSFDIGDEGIFVGGESVMSNPLTLSWEDMQIFGYQNREVRALRIFVTASGVVKEALTTLTLQNTAPVWTDPGSWFLESMEKDLDPPGLLMDMLLNDSFHHTEPLSVAVSGVYGEHLQYRLHPDDDWQDMPEDITQGNALLLAPESRIRMRPPNEFFNGSFDNTVVLTLWETTQPHAPGDRVDMSETGGSTPFSEEIRGISFIIHPVNDAPVATGNTASMPPMNEKEAGHTDVTVADLFESLYFDHDDDPFAGVAIVGMVEGGVGGDWWYQHPGSGDWQPVGSVSDTSALLLPPSANLRFAHGGGTDYGEAPTLQARLYDGTEGSAAGTWDLTSMIGGQGAFSEDTITLRQTVNGVIDDAPTDISLSANSIPEGESGIPVGDLTTEDPDNPLGDTHTYSLVSDPSGLFVIDGSQLRIHPDLRADYEVLSSHTVRVRTTDSVGLSYEKNFTIAVENRNDPPVFLRNARAFDTGSGVELPAAQVTNSYTLEAWMRLDGYRGWSRIVRFSNGQAQDNLVLGFESTGRRLMLETYNGGTGTRVTSDIEIPLHRWFHVAGVNHGNGTATLYVNGVRVGHATGQHNAASVNRTDNALATSTFGSTTFQGVIGQARLWDTWVDQPTVREFGETASFPDGTHNLRFQLFNETGDKNGTPVNNPPAVGIRNIIPQQEGTVTLDRLDFYDPDAASGDPIRLVASTNQGVLQAGGGPHTVTGNGTASLTVDGTRAQLQEMLVLGGLILEPPANTLPNATITLELDDLGNTGPDGPRTATASFLVANTDLPLPPYNLTLSNTIVEENDPGAVVGTLSVSDPNPGDTHTFEIIDNSQNAFEISGGNTLRLKEGVHLNYEEMASHTLLITATDSTGLVVQEEITLTIIDVNDRPMWTEDGFTVDLPPVTETDADPPFHSVSAAFEERYFDEDGDPFLYLAITGNESTPEQGIWEVLIEDFHSEPMTLPVDLGDDWTWLMHKCAVFRFIPNPGFEGDPGRLVVRAWDGSTFSQPGPLLFSSSSNNTAIGNMGMRGSYSVETGFIAATIERVAKGPVYQPAVGRGVIWQPDPDAPTAGWEFGTQWFYGRPIGAWGDPDYGYFGASVYGHYRGGAVSFDERMELASPVIDTAGFTGLRAEFSRWLTRREGRSVATFRVGRNAHLSNPPTSTGIWWPSGDVIDTSWVPVSYELPEAETMRLLWWGWSTFTYAPSDGGWNIDFIRVTAENAPLPVETDSFITTLAGPGGISVAEIISHEADRIDADADVPLAQLGLAITGMRHAAGDWLHSTDGGSTWNPLPEALAFDNALLLGPDARLRLDAPRTAVVFDVLHARLWDGRVGAEGDTTDLAGMTGMFGNISEEELFLSYDSRTGAVPITDLHVEPNMIGTGWPGAEVGNITVTDVSGQTKTYTLLDDSTGKFELDGTLLRLKEGEALESSDVGELTLQVRVVNESGNTIEGPVTVDVVEAGPTGPVAGFGRAATFSRGSAQRLEIEDGLPVQDTSFTFEFWVRNNQPGHDSALLSQGVNAVNEHLHVNLREGGNIHFAFFGNDLTSPSGTIPGHTWTHVALTYDRATGQRRIFRNGELVAEDTAATPDFPVRTFYIGKYNDLHSTLSLDEIRFWNVARSAAEIEENFRTRVAPDSPGLVALYDFEWATPRLTRDRAGNRDARLVNGPSVISGEIPVRVPLSGSGVASAPLTGLDPEGNPLAFNIAEDPGIGTAEIDGDHLAFTPPAAIPAPETAFGYTVTAGGETSAESAEVIFEFPYADLTATATTVAGHEAGATVGDLEFAEGLALTLADDPSGIFTLDGNTLRLKDGFRADAGILPAHTLTLHLEDGDGNVSAHTLDIEVDSAPVPPVLLPPAVALDGQSSVDLPGIPTVTNSYMIEAWIKLEEYREWSRIIRFSNGRANNNLILGFDSSGRRLMLSTHNNGGSLVTSDIDVPLNRWIHVAGVNYGSASNTAAVFINGIRVGFATGQNSAAHVTRSDNAVGSSAWNNPRMRGIVGQARIWDSWVDQGTVLDRMHTPHFDSGPRFQLFDAEGVFNGNPNGNPVHIGNHHRAPASLDDHPLEKIRLTHPEAASDTAYRLTAAVDTGALAAESTALTVTGDITLEGGYGDLRAFLFDGGLAWRPDPAAQLDATVTFTVRDLDADGPAGEAELRIQNLDYNLAPTEIALSGDTLEDGIAAAVIGTLTAVDPNPGDNHDFELIEDPSGLFEIADGNVLRLRDGHAPDRSLFSQHTVTLRATDPGGLSIEADRTLTVEPRNRASVIIPTARQFNGSNTVFAPEVEPVGGAYTIEAWVRRDANRQWARIAEFSNGAGNDTLALALHDNTRRLMLETFVDGASQTRVVSSIIVPHDRWIHVAGVNHGDGTASLYFNGIRVGHATGQNNAADVARAQNQIGNSAFSVPGWFGLVGQTRLWDRALSQTELAAAAQTAAFGENEPDLAFEFVTADGHTTGAAHGPPPLTGARPFASDTRAPLTLDRFEFFDPDGANDDPVRLTATVASGTLTATTSDESLAITGGGTESLAVEGTAAALRTFLRTGGLVYHMPGYGPVDTTLALALDDLAHDAPGGAQTGTGTAAITIDPPDIVVTVQAGDHTREAGAPDPEFEIHISGLPEGESFAALFGGEPEATTAATLQSPPGNYPIDVDLAPFAAPGFALVPGSGTLTITEATTFANWSRHTTGDLIDPAAPLDGDSVPALLAFATARETDRHSPLLWLGEFATPGAPIDIHHHRRTPVSGLEFIIEQSADLVNWSPVEDAEWIATESAGENREHLHHRVPAPESSRVFFRLRVAETSD